MAIIMVLKYGKPFFADFVLMKDNNYVDALDSSCSSYTGHKNNGVGEVRGGKVGWGRQFEA